MNNNEVFVLRTTDQYQAPGEYLKCLESDPDFHGQPRVCGRGLHGWFRGEGKAGCLSGNAEFWQVIKVKNPDIIHLVGHVQFLQGEIIYTGNRLTASKMIKEAYPDNIVVGDTLIKGDRETATVGDYGTAIVGQHGTAIAGSVGMAIADIYGTAKTGDCGNAIVGKYGTAIAGVFGTAKADMFGKAKAGDHGVALADKLAIAGHNGKAIAGQNGKAIVGSLGKAEAGQYGTVMAGRGGLIAIKFWDERKMRLSITTGNIGYNDLLPDTPYILDLNGKFIPANEDF